MFRVEFCAPGDGCYGSLWTHCPFDSGKLAYRIGLSKDVFCEFPMRRREDAERVLRYVLTTGVTENEVLKMSITEVRKFLAQGLAW